MFQELFEGGGQLVAVSKYTWGRRVVNLQKVIKIAVLKPC